MAKILLIEDYELARDTISRMIVADGHQLFTAANAADALQIWELEKPDVAICDVNLPRSEPAAVIRALRSRDPQLKIIAISGDLSAFNASTGVAQIGADRLLHKPFRRSELIEVLQQVGITGAP